MNTLISRIGMLVLVAVLGGCGTETRVMNSNPDSVSIIFDGDQSTMAEVNKLATAECQKGSRMAVLRDISSVEDGRVANYDCNRP